MTQNFLAVFTGSKTSPKMQAWMAMSEEQQKARMVEGIALWKGWMEKHKDILVEHGGPLGKTRKISDAGIEDISNNLSGFVVIKAESQEEAARLFVGHPHFAHFPGESVEVMPVMPIPGG